jgi:hypothetical protein
MINWKLTDEHINRLQVDDVDHIIKRAKKAHFVNIEIRINGKWEKYEGDWIKYLKRESTEFIHPDPYKRCQHDLLKDATTIELSIDNATIDDNAKKQVAKCSVCLKTWLFLHMTNLAEVGKHINQKSVEEEKHKDEILQRFHAPKEDCPNKTPKDECHLSCCGDACEGEGCERCGPDV